MHPRAKTEPNLAAGAKSATCKRGAAALQRTYRFRGGEAEALKRLKHYLWGTDAVADYFNTRNGAFPPLWSLLNIYQLSVPVV